MCFKEFLLGVSQKHSDNFSAILTWGKWEKNLFKDCWMPALLQILFALFKLLIYSVDMTFIFSILLPFPPSALNL